MMARIIASLVGGDPEKYMPKIESEMTEEEMFSMLPGVDEYAYRQGIDIGNH